MITQWLIDLGTGLASWLSSLLPHWDVPSWFSGLGDSINSLFAWGSGLGPLVNWAAIAAIASVPIGLWAAGLLFKLGRMVLSHVPFFGGK